MRFLPIGPHTLLVELADLDEALTLFDALKADPVPGAVEIIPAARTLMIRTGPGTTADGALARAIRSRQPAPGTARPVTSINTVEIPMTYDGADLADVADHLDLTVAEVIAAHQATTWQVAFCGFAPGFAYMTGDDPRFDLPRRPAPRTRIPAGSVALAARFCGIYPQDMPGGWQLIGTTGLPMWDLSRDPPALLQPGARIRFVEGQASVHPVAALPEPARDPALTVVQTAFPLVFQDEGRPGQGGQGVSASGALDIGALRRANRAVGNPAGSPALEITLGPVRLRAEMAVTLALTGAARAQLQGRTLPPLFALDAGDEILIPPPSAGMRGYLALRGGFDVTPALGSAATDTLAGIGPPVMTAGAALSAAHCRAAAVTDIPPEPELPQQGDVIPLPVTLGPRADWFSDDMIRQFLEQDWLVTPQSSRVGIRLDGQAITRADNRELPSEGTEAGAIQIPHSGQPVLFLADHPLTGGYPVIATLHPDALDLAGQIPPGARIRFTADTSFSEIEPLP